MKEDSSGAKKVSFVRNIAASPEKSLPKLPEANGKCIAIVKHPKKKKFKAYAISISKKQFQGKKFNSDDALALLLDKGYKLQEKLVKSVLVEDNLENCTHNEISCGELESCLYPEIKNDVVKLAHLEDDTLEFVLGNYLNNEHLSRHTVQSGVYCSSGEEELSEIDDPLHDEHILENLFYSENFPKLEELKCIVQSNNNIVTISDKGELKNADYIFANASIFSKLKNVRFIRIYVDSLVLSKEVVLPTKVSSKISEFYLVFEIPNFNATSCKVNLHDVSEKITMKQILSKEFYIGHRSVIPWQCKMQTHSMKNFSILFKVYHRYCDKDMVPNLLGLGTFNFLDVLKTENFIFEENLKITNKKNKSNPLNGTEFGNLKIKIELVADQRVVESLSNLNKMKNMKPTANILPELPQVMWIEPTNSNKSISKPKEFDSENIHLDRVTSCTENSLTIYCLLEVTDGAFQPNPLKNSSTGRNLYIISRLFWNGETVQSKVCWDTLQPIFNFLQIAPLKINSNLLERTNNNVMVLEVWETCHSEMDKLVGLVKLPLHLFYLSLCDKSILQSLLLSPRATLSLDNFVAVIDIVTGEVVGELGVLFAFGTQQQIENLQLSRRKKNMNILPATKNEFNEHIIYMVIENIQNLQLHEETVWGEADCFIEYLFPNQKKDELYLQLYETTCKLCKPDITFDYHCEHKFLFPSGDCMQDIFDKVLSRRGIIFNIWCKFYSPDQRKYLLAEAFLPLEELTKCTCEPLQLESKMSIPLHYVSESNILFKGESNLKVSLKCGIFQNSDRRKNSTKIISHAGKSTQTDIDILKNEDIANFTPPCVKPSNFKNTHSNTYSAELSTSKESLFESKDVFSVSILIEKAASIHPISFQNSSSCEPNTYVLVESLSPSQELKTNTIYNSRNPEWMWQKIIPMFRYYLNGKKKVIFKVIHRNAGSHGEYLIGFASVDLSPLSAGLQQLSGWYNIINFQGECKGQLMVTIRPLKKLQDCELTVEWDMDINERSFATSANYSKFPSHLSQFSEQNIKLITDSSNNSEHCSQCYMSSMVEFLVPSNENDVSMSTLHACLRKELDELDELNKLLLENLSFPDTVGKCSKSTGTGFSHLKPYQRNNTPQSSDTKCNEDNELKNESNLCSSSEDLENLFKNPHSEINGKPHKRLAAIFSQDIL